MVKLPKTLESYVLNINIKIRDSVTGLLSVIQRNNDRVHPFTKKKITGLYPLFFEILHENSLESFRIILIKPQAIFDGLYYKIIQRNKGKLH